MLAVLVVSVTTYLALREAGVGPFGTLLTRGVLEERDRIVLADFENQAGDPRIAVVATQWFRTALSQSTAVQVAGQEYVANVLLRMERLLFIEGVVLDEEGHPVPHADVDYADLGEEPSLDQDGDILYAARALWVLGKTDDEGRFRLHVDEPDVVA
ncbi:MAG: hypothetical protein JSU89_09825, partial [Myxococcales bacterium]